MIAFLDASAVIYAVEGSAGWAEALKHPLRQLARSDQASTGGLQLAADSVMVSGDAGFQRVPSLGLALVNGGEGGD